MALERVFHELVSDATIDWEGTASQEDFFLLTDQCLEEMDAFLAAMSQPYASFVAMLNHGPEVTVEIGWQDLLAGQLVWDRWTAAVDDPVMAFASIGFLFDARDYRWETKQTEAEEPPCTATTQSALRPIGTTPAKSAVSTAHRWIQPPGC